MKNKYEEVLRVTCSLCKAKAGQHCHKGNADPALGEVGATRVPHVERKRLARAVVELARVQGTESKA